MVFASLVQILNKVVGLILATLDPLFFRDFGIVEQILVTDVRSGTMRGDKDNTYF